MGGTGVTTPSPSQPHFSTLFRQEPMSTRPLTSVPVSRYVSAPPVVCLLLGIDFPPRRALNEANFSGRIDGLPGLVLAGLIPAVRLEPAEYTSRPIRAGV